jgi:hypothetical protein
MKSIIIITFISLISCKAHHHHGLKETLIEKDKNQIEVKSDQISKTRLDGFKYQKSEWKKKNNFHVLERFSDFKIQKCKSCHEGTNKVPSKVSNHDHIKINHADKETMKCSTCHKSKNTWDLHLLEGDKVSINHPYKLCSQCHFQQVEDWSNGSHGKRVGGWHGKRVIKNCTDCHNPHAPQFHKQMPKVTPNFIRFKK